MGRHTAPRPLFLTALDATARLGAGLAHRASGSRAAGSLTRRSLTGAGAAVAAVALTASAATATLLDGSTAPSHTSTPTTSATPSGAAFGAPVVTADPAVVDAASDELVRADFVSRESSGALPADQATQIEQARAALEDALDRAATSGAPAPTEGTTEAGAPAADARGTEDADGTAADAETSQALADREGGRASRTAERTPLEELAAPLEEAPTLTPPLVRLPAEDADDAGLPAPLPAVNAAPTAEQDPAAEGSTEQTTAGQSTAEADATAAAAEPAATDEEITALTTELRTLLDASEAGIAVEVAPAPPAPEVAVPATPVPEVVPAPPSPEEIAAQLAAWAVSTEGYGNGQIPTDVLCEVSFAPGELLRCDAAHQFEALNATYREAFGADISVTDSYRSFDEQVSMKASRGYFAAVPGTSNHGWGLALDLGGGIQDYGTAQYEWMRANAPAFGFDNPEWARAGGSKNEPWHWEFGDLS